MAGVTFGESYTPVLRLAFTQNVSNIEKDVHRISNSPSLYVHSGDLAALGKIVKVKNSTEGAIANKTIGLQRSQKPWTAVMKKVVYPR
jgi:hypothetical protein